MTVGLEGPINVLVVEDDEDDFLIASEMLRRHDRFAFALEWAETYEAALEAIRQRRHDVYLLDYRLGARTGLELLREAFAGEVHAPAIMLTGEGDPRIDQEASAQGIADFLLKHELTTPALERTIRYAISQHRAVRELARREERYALAVRGASDAIWDWDLIAGRIYLSPRWYAIAGLAERHGEEDPATWFDLVHQDDLLRLRANIDSHLAAEASHVQFEHRIRHGDGSWRWVLIRGLAVYDETGVPTRLVGSMSDITDRRNTELQLEHDALHDSLTGLPNRALFLDRLGQAISRCNRSSEALCAVLFLDVDQFKLINDRLSHSVGDRLLAALAGRLAATLRPGDTVARIGGDEFAIVLDRIGGVEGAEAVARWILDALEQPFSVDGHQLSLTGSVGIALGDERSAPAELLRGADTAMYDAKGRGRGCAAVFDEAMHRQVVRRLTRENDLRGAIEQSLLEVHYQPIIDLATGAFRAFEALVRWPPGPRSLPPSEFIPIAEDVGLIGVLGMRVMQTALLALASWRREGLVDERVYMSINVSGRQFDDPAFPAQVRIALDRAGLPSGALRLELSESTLMQEADVVAGIVCEISGCGVRLHLDNFGTGYSSLSTLHRLPVEALKIDRSFLTGLGEETGENDVIVSSAVALGHSLGLQVIAEGIEKPSQLRRLRTVGCEYGQGHLFSPPLGEQATRTLLLGWSAPEVAVLGDQV